MEPLDRHASRRGNYAVLGAFALASILAIGALAIDISYIRLAQAQAQAVADASSQAALMVLRRTGETSQATAAAQTILDQNLVAGEPAELTSIAFGIWDEAAVANNFVLTEDAPNAVRVMVDRAGDNALQLFLAPVIGHETFDVTRTATSAGRVLQVVLVMDITGSWNQTNFRNARNAAVNFLETVQQSFGDEDRIGMVIFTGRYAWEYTPLTLISSTVSTPTVRNNWLALNVASKAGRNNTFPAECTLKSGTSINNFTTANAGGCYPAMPREYQHVSGVGGEPGTDHTTGITLARTLFTERPDPFAYRAMIVLTDGIPNGILSHHGNLRTSAGYNETRWRQYLGPRPHSTSQIQSESNTLTSQMWDDMNVHTWVISFVQDGSFMHTMPKGQGYYTLTNNSAALTPIFEEIANQLPMAIVE